MDTNTEKLVRDTVTQFVTDGYMFTAYDVTRTLRKAGTSLHHKEVNTLIQGMFKNSEMGSYVRDAVDVNASVMPFVYYHPYGDVSKYDQDWTNSNPTQTGMKVDTATAPTNPTSSGGYTPPSLDGTSAPVTVASSGTGAQVSSPFAPTTKVKLAKGERLTTKNGRLQIPIHMARNQGYIPHQEVYVVVGTAGLVLSSLSGHGASIEYPVTVNKDGRIRICRKILKNISTGNKFLVSRNSQIVISAA